MKFSRQRLIFVLGARFGPKGIRIGSQRIEADAGWNIYTGMNDSCINRWSSALSYIVQNNLVLIEYLGENVFKSWAQIVDCGDVPSMFGFPFQL